MEPSQASGSAGKKKEDKRLPSQIRGKVGLCRKRVDLISHIKSYHQYQVNGAKKNVASKFRSEFLGEEE